MQKIPIILAKAGMILARDVYRGDSPVGIPVCGKNTALTDSLLMRFENMDITTIYVEGHPVPEEGDRTIDDILRDLDGRFIKSIHMPLNALLYEVYKSYLIKSMGADSDRQAE